MRRLLSIITMLFFPLISTLGQNHSSREWYLTQSNGGLCNQSLVLFSDSSYCSESGCEASSHFSFGKWTQKKNQITFYPVINKTFKVIKSVESLKMNDNLLTVEIYDKDGINITQQISIGQFVKSVGTYNLDLDSSKSKRTDLKRINGIIILKSLQILFQQKLEITTDTTNYYKITLNISGNWNFHSNSNWENSGSFILQKTGGRLYSLRPNQFNDKGELHKTEYIKQKE